MASETVVTVSWLTRLKQSIVGVFFGLGVVVAMVALLFWNEGRAVRTADALAEGAGAVVAASAEQIEPGNEGKLVHVSGQVSTAAPLADNHFGVAVTALQLRRKVEMFQWAEQSTTEKKANLGGSETQTTRYEYLQKWSEQRLDSSKFHDAAAHVNPAMTIESATFTAADARLGAWQLDGQVIGRIGGAQPYSVRAEDAAAILRALPEGSNASIVEGDVYLAANPSQPRIGDYRISYEQVPVSLVSIVGRQQGKGIGSYHTTSGEPLLIVHAGAVPATAMFDAAVSSNVTQSWVFRGLGIVGLIFAFSTVLRPFSVAGSVLPLLGNVVAAGSGLIAAALGIGMGALTIAAAWLFHRPLLAITIVVAAFALVAGLIWLLRRKAAPAPALPVANAPGIAS